MKWGASLWLESSSNMIGTVTLEPCIWNRWGCEVASLCRYLYAISRFNVDIIHYQEDVGGVNRRWVTDWATTSLRYQCWGKHEFIAFVWCQHKYLGTHAFVNWYGLGIKYYSFELIHIQKNEWLIYVCYLWNLGLNIWLIDLHQLFHSCVLRANFHNFVIGWQKGEWIKARGWG